MRILLDVTRTLIRRNNPSPTGIDRVEVAFMERLLENEDHRDVGFVITTPYGNALLPRAAMREIMDEAASRRDAITDSPEGAFRKLVSALEQPIDRSRASCLRIQAPMPRLHSFSAYLKIFRESLRWRQRFRTVQRDVDGNESVYIHVSHSLMQYYSFYSWTKAKNIHASFFIHDLIPIDYPEFSTQKASRRHPRRVRTAAMLGSTFIVNSRYTKDRLQDYLEEHDLPRLPIFVSPLGSVSVDPAQLPPPPAAQIPYFVCLGTIEGRKNLPFLLNVWRRLIELCEPDAVPRLVIAGKRGWQSRDVFEVLDRSCQLASYIIEVAGLTDAEVTSLIDGSNGVLAPSLVEGYGLSPVEAICRGLPVVASDIAAHREILGDHAILLDPTDGPGWLAAIRSLARGGEARREQVARLAGFPRVTWQDHVDLALDSILANSKRHAGAAASGGPGTDPDPSTTGKAAERP